ncbi:hypothetical protein D9M72_244220 [compost metagenome]
MPTPKFKPRPQMGTQSRKDWKDHPLAIAVVVAVGTAVFFMTVVVPLRVDLLTAKVERLAELSANSASIAKELERTKRELAEVRAALQTSLLKSPFQDRSVYPLGFDEVVIGTPVAELISRYPDGTWDEERAYYSVNAKFDAVVTGGTYYFTERGGKGKVSQILFHLASGEKAGTDLARKHFLTNFGEPDATRRRSMFWRATDREWVTLDAPHDPLPGAYRVYAVNAAAPTYEFDLLKR